jgi:regulation of enolase protein 1 (concanavalin A-like superfamily)
MEHGRANQIQLSIKMVESELLHEGSDWWRTTAYGFIHDDGHALVKDFPNESSMEVSFMARPRRAV